MTSAARRVARGAVGAPGAVLVTLLKVYRVVCSPMTGPSCRYYPSCSAYALEAVRLHGAVRGAGLAAWRLARCNPWSRGGVDHVPLPIGLPRCATLPAPPLKEGAR